MASCTAKTAKSTTNCAVRATTRSAGPAVHGCALAIASTATGPIENQALDGWSSSRLGGSSPFTSLGSSASTNAPETAIGTIAGGIANISGTNAS